MANHENKSGPSFVVDHVSSGYRFELDAVLVRSVDELRIPIRLSVMCVMTDLSSTTNFIDLSLREIQAEERQAISMNIGEDVLPGRYCLGCAVDKNPLIVGASIFDRLGRVIKTYGYDLVTEEYDCDFNEVVAAERTAPLDDIVPISFDDLFAVN